MKKVLIFCSLIFSFLFSISQPLSPALSDSNANVIVKGGLVVNGGIRVPKAIYVVVTGQSNVVNRDITKGTVWDYTVTNQIKSFTSGNVFASANPATNNIAYDDVTTAERNNLALPFAKQHLRYFPYDTVYIVCSGQGSQGTPYWTPATTGPGEYVSSNAQLTLLMGKLNNTPSYFKADVLIFQGGEDDDANNNIPYYLQNIMAFYDTCKNMTSKFKPGFTFLLNYPAYNNGNSLYDSLCKAIDSIPQGTKDLSLRNIKTVRFNLPTTDNTHYTNEAFETIGLLDFNAWFLNSSVGLVMNDTAIIKKGSGFNYVTQPLLIGSNSQVASLYPLQASVTGSSNLAAFGRTDGANPQQLRFAPSTGDWTFQHYANGSNVNQLLINDTSFRFQTGAGTDKFTIGHNSIIIPQNTFISGNVSLTGTEIKNTGIFRSSTVSATEGFVCHTNSSSTGANGQFVFRVGTSGNGLPAGKMQMFFDGTGTSLRLFVSSALSSFDQIMTLDRTQRVAIDPSITSPTALLHLGASTTTRSALRFQGGVAPTSANKGDVYQDTTGTNPVLKYYDGTTTFILAKTLTGSATLDFDLTSVNSQDLTITVTGAADGNPVSVGFTNTAATANVTFTWWVSGTNTVTVRASRIDVATGANPASATFTASVIKY